MFNLAYATDLEETYNKIKDIDTGGFATLSNELENHIVHFNNNMVFLFNSANSSWACSTKDSADNSVATIKASLEAIKPSAELVGEVGPLVRSAIDNISDYIEAYQNYIQVKKSKPSETIRDVDAKGNQDRKANPAYSDWENITFPNAYYNASNLENTSRASLNNIMACLSGKDVSNATISPVSLGEGQFMVAIEETLPDGNVKRGYKVQDADGNVLKEIYNITDENNIVIQSSIVTYDKEKNTKSEEYTLYSSNGDTVNGTKDYDQLSRVISDTYTDTNGNKHTLTNQYVSDTTDLSFVEEKIESVIDEKSAITDKTTPYHGGNAGNTEYKVYYEDNPDEIIRSGTIDSEGIEHNSYVEKKVADISSSSSTDIETVEFAESNSTSNDNTSIEVIPPSTASNDDTSTEVTPPSISSNDDTSTEVTPPSTTSIDDASTEVTPSSTTSIDDASTEVTPPGTSSNNGLSVELTPTKSPSSSSTSVGPVSPSISSEPKTRDEIKSEILSTVDEKGMKLGDDLVGKIADDVYDNQGSNTGSTFISTPSTNTSVSPSTPVDPSEIYKFDGNFGGSKTRDEIRLEVLKDMYKLGVKPDEKLIDSQVEYRYNNQNNQ